MLLLWFSCVNFLSFWVLEIWMCPIFYCSYPLALVWAQKEGIVSQRMPQAGGGVMGECGHHGPALFMALTMDLSRYERQHGPCCQSAASSLSPGSLSVLASCWSPGLNRPLLSWQFKCFGCWTIFRIAGRYSFIPIDWAQYLGGEPLSHSLYFLLFTPTSTISFLLAWLFTS